MRSKIVQNSKKNQKTTQISDTYIEDIEEESWRIFLQKKESEKNRDKNADLCSNLFILLL